MKKIGIYLLLMILVLSAAGCNKKQTTISDETTSTNAVVEDNTDKYNHTPGTATEITVNANKEWYEKLDFSDEKEFENATKGLIEAPESVVIYNEDGSIAWSVDALGDVSGEAPDTVNPSLWRN